MTELTGPHWRAIRATTVAVVSGMLAVAGHTFGGGGSPHLVVVLLLSALVGGVTSGFARTERGLPTILGIMVAAQVLYHLGFLAGDHHGHSAALPSAPMVAFHLVAAVLAAVIIQRSERALFALRACLSRALPAPFSASAVPDRVLPSLDLAPRPQLAFLLGGGLSRRGPPRVCPA